MANDSAKKIAAGNKFRLRILIQGFLISHAVHLFSFWLKPSTRTTYHYILYAVSSAVSLALWATIYKIGTPVYDANGTLIRSGENLMQPGLTEYMFDTIFITWIVHILTAIFPSYKLWLLYLGIPAFAFEKIYYSVISPRLFPPKEQAQPVPLSQKVASNRQSSKKSR